MKTKFLAIVAILALTFTSCEKDDPEIHEEEELITTVIYTLTPSEGAIVTYTFKDLDGDGSNEPVLTNSGNLKANTTYTGAIRLLNELEDPAEEITTEVKEKDKEHQFFFTSTVSGLTVAYNDKDGDNNPVGLSNTLTTTTAGDGTLNIILRHEPNKSASGVSDGEIANAGGESDIDVTFNINVQ